MFQSILEDAKQNFRNGNMITRLILINVVVFIIIVILGVFTKGWVLGDSTMYQQIMENLAFHPEIVHLLKRPWTFISHMFLHEGPWHILWNMLLLYWFGIIVGDLIGDRKILPLYILGGLMGAVIYILACNFTAVPMIPALGASAAVMAIVMAAGVTAPDYEMRLILIGRVRLKYIVLWILIIDLIRMSSAGTSGSSIAHFGGALYGALYVNGLRHGYNLAWPVEALVDFFNKDRSIKKVKAPMRVAHRSNLVGDKKRQKSRADNDGDFQQSLDRILEKVKAQGFDKLSDEEKEFLYQASKK